MPAQGSFCLAPHQMQQQHQQSGAPGRQPSQQGQQARQLWIIAHCWASALSTHKLMLPRPAPGRKREGLSAAVRRAPLARFLFTFGCALLVLVALEILRSDTGTKGPVSEQQVLSQPRRALLAFVGVQVSYAQPELVEQSIRAEGMQLH